MDIHPDRSPAVMWRADNPRQGRGLHPSTFQLNLSRFWHNIHPKHTLIPPNTSYTPPNHPLNAPPIPQKALELSRKVNECRPLRRGHAGPYRWLTYKISSRYCRRSEREVGRDHSRRNHPRQSHSRRRAYTTSPGRAVHVEPMKPVFEARGTMRLTVRYDELLSKFAFNFNLRRYT